MNISAVKIGTLKYKKYLYWYVEIKIKNYHYFIHYQIIYDGYFVNNNVAIDYRILLVLRMIALIESYVDET